MNIRFRQYWDLLVKYLKPQWPRVTLLALLLFGSIGLQLVNPQILRYFIDAARGDGAPGVLTIAALLFIAASLLNQALSVGATYISQKVGWSATNDLRADLAAHCLGLDMSFHNLRTPGEMIERIDGDILNLANFFSQFVIRILGNVLLLFGVILVLFREDLRVGLALTLFALLTLTSLILFRNIAVPHWRKARGASADLFGFLEEHLSGTEDIRSSGATPYAMRLLYKFTGERLRKERKAGVMNIWLRTLMTLFYTLGQALALGLGFLLFRNNSITIGTVFLIVYYTDILFRPLQQITRQMEDLQKASASIVRIQELYHTESNIKDGPGIIFPAGALAIELHNTSFGYRVVQF